MAQRRGAIFSSLPYHVPQEPDPFELDKMLVSARALGVRFPSVTHPGLPSGIYACQLKNYDMGCVHIKQRPRVRRGLENFEIRRAGDSELRAQGLVINRETMARQGRYDSEFGDSARWNRLVDAIFRARAVEVYGAYLRSRLAAYLVTCRDGGWVHLMHQMSRTADLELHPNHALTFSVTKLVSEDSTLEGVSYGLAALNDGPGLHEYKLRLGYAFLERTSVFHLHPLAAPAFRSSLLKGESPSAARDAARSTDRETGSRSDRRKTVRQACARARYGGLKRRHIDVIPRHYPSPGSAV